MDADEQGPGRQSERSGRIPIHLLLSTPETVAQQQQQQQQQRQQQPDYSRPAGSSSNSGAPGRKESFAVTGGPPSADGFASSSSPCFSPSASASGPLQASENSYVRVQPSEYTPPLQPQHVPFSSYRVDAAGASPPRSPSDPMTRKPRAPRPSYSEEQKFFIMYARIMRDLSWPEIEDRFADTFGQRSKGGLTSVYYRVRRDWGLAEVLKSGPGTFAADCREVELRARNFSKEFLVQIGYIPAG
ncbi:unnamed protein product [Zymoseptoria tritici ST99CH_3D7]|uniref:Uncharacterized protein n=1 Tax=Zymoseptoria tritici (strain ST99CH_3D7) TaxID=1276538 RepID=A0A1X7RML9_ZYMT9|nr:unnamed protein product [Zymoseptoria tritici ST99CH_3D7]